MEVINKKVPKTKKARAPNPTVNGNILSKCHLIIDHREDHVTRHRQELAGINYSIEQLEIGDYAVTYCGKILATIERKSLDDYGASIKDGRHDNKQKLIGLRELTNCRIIYIIEGKEFPGPTECFANIPYRYIESSIFHLMIRDNITTMRSKDSLHTAQLLARFISSMDTLCAHDKLDVNELNLVNSAPTVGTNYANGADESDIQSELYNSLQVLRTKHKKSDHDVVREMWACFAGITVESASEYMNRWTIAEIIRGTVRDDIAVMKLSSGRAINKNVIASLTTIGRPLEIRLLSTIPGISKASATKLIDTTPLSRLLSYGLEISIEIIGPGRRLGSAAAESVVKYFNYKYMDDVHADIKIEPELPKL